MDADSRLVLCQQLAAERGGMCLSDTYGGSKTKMRWRCALRHEWDALGTTIRRGSWCRLCAHATRGAREKAENFTRMKALARERGGACLSAEYVDSQTPLRWRCADGHEWAANANSVQQGCWCPACAGTQRLDLAAMRAMAHARGGDCISTEYVNIWTPLWWRCAEGHEWQAPPNRVRHNETWCQVCAHRSTKTLGDLQALAARFGGTCLAPAVTRIHDEYRWRCKLGHVFAMTAHQVQRGHWCARCRGRGAGDLARMKRIARRRGGACLSTKYVNATTPLVWRCREGHEWDAVPGSVVQGSWCWTCGHATSSTTPLTIADLQATAAARGGQCLSTTYANVHTRARWRCALGHEWRARVANVRRGSWCPTCAQRFPGTIDGMRRLAVERGGRCLSDEYTGHKTLLWFECGAGHRFEARGVAVKSGVWCGECAAGDRASGVRGRGEQRERPP